ncbi:hypothetical protein C8J56DRAFT_917523, partial [Mycena floridula]
MPARAIKDDPKSPETRLKYLRILEREQAVLARDPEAGREALLREELGDQVASRVNLEYEDLKGLLKDMMLICRTKPKNLDDHARIALAANAVFSILSAQQATKPIQPNLGTVSHRLVVDESQIDDPEGTRVSYMCTIPTRHLDEFEENPFQLIEHRFILMAKGHDYSGRIYHVSDVEKRKNGQYVAYIQSDAYWDAEEFGLEELLSMIKHSRYH